MLTLFDLTQRYIGTALRGASAFTFFPASSLSVLCFFSFITFFVAYIGSSRSLKVCLQYLLVHSHPELHQNADRIGSVFTFSVLLCLFLLSFSVLFFLSL